MDSDLRELERRAIEGDRQARDRLGAAQWRAGVGWPHEIVRVDCRCGGTGWLECDPRCCNGFPCPEHPGARRENRSTLESLLREDRERHDVDVPSLRNPVEGRGWKLAWRQRCPTGRARARAKRRAHRVERQAAKRVLRGGHSGLKKRTGNSWDVV
jgi:hypothetical protein